MASDKNDQETAGLTDDMEIELESTDEGAGLSAGSRDYDDYDGDLDVDITGDENIDFADDEGEKPVRGEGKLKKLVAPALVLVIAAGVGGYIVMNPQILSQITGEASAVSPSAQPAAAVAQAPQDITEDTAVAQADDMFSDSLPQPTVNQNETPRPPEDEGSADITEVAMQPASSVEEVPETTMPETPVQEEAAEPEAPAEMAVTDTPEPEDWNFPEEGEQGSADGQTDSAEMVAAEEPAAPPETGDVFEVKFSDNEPAEAPAAAEPAPQESFEVAQAEVTQTPGAEPPAMPESAPAPAPSAGAPAVPAPSPQAAPTAQASGTAARPVQPAADAPADADVYYDGRVPTGPLATETGPRKVDPVMEPASQLVVVKKTHEAKDMESLLVSANRALELKRYDSALDMFNQLYEKNKRDPRILMGKAVALQNSGMAESAIKTYEELLDINPNNADAMLNMLGLLRQQYPSVALRRLLDLHDKHPSNAGIAAQIGVTEADLNHPQEAMRYLGIASTLEPRNAQHIFNMAIIADRNGDTKNAIKYYEQALELDAVYSGGRSIPRESVYDRLATLRRR